MPSASQSAHPEVCALYTAHHGWLQSWLRRRLGNAFDAADLAQDTFVRILVAPADAPARPQGWQLDEPRAYLTVIAKRLLANLYRRRSLEQAYLDTLAQLPEPLYPSPEQRALLLESLQSVDAMLDGLPAPVRTAFLMAQLEGLGQAEIAGRLGISERTVRRHLTQAMARCIVCMP
jgi:RNA polymerase sigma-70 factor (ECF subfamily)